MKKKLFRSQIYIKQSPTHGYGVFAGKKFRKGEKIEECYAIISRGGDKKLEDYYFDANGKYATLTGFGSIYNHADDPNADHLISPKKCLATFTANRTINKGEEIFISYGKQWFSTRNIKPAKF